jgi:hypothetical protein
MVKKSNITILDHHALYHYYHFVDMSAAYDEKTSWIITSPMKNETTGQVKRAFARCNNEQVRVTYASSTSKIATTLFNESCALVKIAGALTRHPFYVGNGALCDERGKCLLLVSMLFDSMDDYMNNKGHDLRDPDATRDRIYIEVHPIIMDKRWREENRVVKKLIIDFFDYLEMARARDNRPYEVHFKEQINFIETPVVPVPDEENWVAFNLALLENISL